jgi:hypothetical protein
MPSPHVNNRAIRLSNKEVRIADTRPSAGLVSTGCKKVMRTVGGVLQAAEKLASAAKIAGFVSGHGFTRAANAAI